MYLKQHYFPFNCLVSAVIHDKKKKWIKQINLLFPDSSVGKESTYNVGDPGLIPGSGRSAGEGIGYPLQYSWPSFVTQLVKNPPAMQETWVQSLGWEIPWRRERLPTPVFRPRKFRQRVRHDWMSFTFNSYIYLPNLFSTIVYTFIKLTENRNLYQP